MSGREEVLDEPIVAQLLDLGPEVVAELVELYAQQLTTLMVGIRDSDDAEVRRAAHTLKGSSANLGLLQVARLAGAIEAGGADAATIDLIEPAAQSGLAELRTRSR